MHHKTQTLVAVSVLEADQLLPHLHRDRQLLHQFAGDGGGDRLTGLLLATRKLPQPPQQPLVEALIDQHPAIAVEHHTNADHLKRQLARGVLHGVAGRVAGSVGIAVPLPGTQAAAGIAGRTNGGAQIHQSLVERPGPLGIEQLLAQPPEPGELPRRWPRAGDQTRQHPFHIAVEDRDGQIKGRRQDAAGRAAADARQGQPALQINGPGAVQARRCGQQLARTLPKTASTAVVAETLPEQQHIMVVGRRKTLQGREHVHPTPPVRQHHLQLGLLQHHLGHPDTQTAQPLTRRRPATSRCEHPGLLGLVEPTVQLPPGEQRAA